MLTKDEIDRLPIPELAARMLSALDSMINGLAGEITVLRDDMHTIGRLKTKSEADEREKALTSHASAHQTAKQRLEQVRREGGLGGLGSPVQTAKGMLAVRAAHAELVEAEDAFDAPAATTKRTANLKAHNEYVAHQRARLATVQGELSDLNAAKTIATQFRTAAEAVAAAQSEGWMGREFPAGFRDIAHHVHARDFASASKRLSTLVFQRLPSEPTYEQWKSEAAAIRTEAYSDHAGMAASGSYAEIASHSVDLANKSLRSRAQQIIGSFPHPAEQWQALTALLRDPRNLRTDALWAVYWAMFQCGQWMANALFEADAHEDIFNGKLSAQIDRWLTDWAAQRVPEFGYPGATSYMGTLDIASATEETRLGADIGVIIDLNIGDLVCRKVVLFQAKKAKKGSADVGSDTAQLPKLAARPQLGFYLFYHQLPDPLFPPAPSVACAHELADLVTKSGRSPGASSLTLNVNSTGWDWANFISFGLCDPASPYGATFTTASQALDILGGGDPGHLPRYLHVIAITDEPRVRELRAEIRKRYRERLLSKDKDHQKKRSHDRKNNGPDHSMGRYKRRFCRISERLRAGRIKCHARIQD